MKKNIFKKIVASLATAAMAVGMFAAMPAEEAKAAVSKEIVFVLSDATNIGDVVVQIDANNINAACSASEMEIPGWGGAKGYVTTKEADGRYKITITAELDVSTEPNNYCTLKFVPLNADNSATAGGKNFYTQNYADVYNANSTVYVSVDMSDTSWESGLSVSADDPAAAKPADIIAIIDKIGTVELTDECLTKIKAAETAYNNFTGDKSAITNYSTLTAARAKYDSLQAAEDAKNAGKLTVYVKNADWKQMNVYGWDGAEFGNWPGLKLTALENNAGWYSCSFDITKATNLIFNDGTTQTVDWKGVAAGTYWVTLSAKGSDGKYLVDDSNVSTKAPEGWKDEKAQEIENSAPTTTTKAQETTTAVPTIIPQADVDKIAAGATVTGNPADSTLKFTAITEDAAKAVETFKTSTLKGMTFQALDIKLVDKDGNAVQPGGAIEITLSVTDSLKSAKKIEVFRVDGDKLVSLGQSDVKDGKITFKTDHFSTYVFAEVKTSTNTGDMTSVSMMFAVAAMAGVAVVAMRKKAVNE